MKTFLGDSAKLGPPVVECYRRSTDLIRSSAFSVSITKGVDLRHPWRLRAGATTAAVTFRIHGEKEYMSMQASRTSLESGATMEKGAP